MKTIRIQPKAGIWTRMLCGPVLISGGAAGAAQAQDIPTTITISPRASIMFDDFDSFRNIAPPNQASPFRDFVAAGAERSEDAADFVVPMYGGSLSVSPGFWPGSTFTATYMEGTDDTADSEGRVSDFASNVSVNGQVVPATLNAQSQTNGEYTRREFELTGQLAINDLTSFMAGVRIEQGEWEYQSCFQFFVTHTVPQSTGPNVSRAEAAQICADQPTGAAAFGSINFPTDTSSPTVGSLLPGVSGPRAAQPLNVRIVPKLPMASVQYTMSTLRFGFTGLAPLTEDLGHSFYTTGLIGIGYREVDDSAAQFFSTGAVAGPDMTAGYRWQIADDWALDVRYRVQAFWGISGDAADDDRPQITHGAMISLSKSFG